MADNDKRKLDIPWATLLPLAAVLAGIVADMMFFDPIKVGFKEPPPRPTGPSGELTQRYFLFDTREKRNGNQGHTYGTQLANEDKEKLLEYLKTL